MSYILIPDTDTFIHVIQSAVYIVVALLHWRTRIALFACYLVVGALYVTLAAVHYA